MAESWSIGGVSVTSGAFKMMELNADPPPARTSWLTAADSETAVLMRKPLHENRKITMKLKVNPQASMDTALNQIGTLLDKLSAASDTAAGTPVVWSPANSARSLTFTALNAEITGLPIGLDGLSYAWFQGAPVIDVQLDCKPYGAGTEVSAGTAAGTAPIVTKEIGPIPGDVPALGRLVVTDLASQSRRHVEWGLEGPLTYNSSTSLMVDSDNMVTTGFSGSQTTSTGAYDPNASGNSVISAAPIPGAVTAICGTGNLSHIGVFRVKARVKVGSTDNEFRLSWRAGDGPMSSNAWVSATATDWVELDLGSIRIAAVLSGTQRWTGQVEVLGAASSPGTVVIDYLVLVPQSDGYGVARAAYAYRPGVVVGYDSFIGTTSGNALGTRTAPLGGSWATSGDAGDFLFDDNLNGVALDGIETLARQTSAGSTSGRFAILGSTAYTDMQVDARIRASFASGGYSQDLIVRWVDSSNHVRLVVPAAGSATSLRIEQVKAGVISTLASSSWVRADTSAFSLNTYRVRLIAYVSGRVIGQVFSDSGALLAQLDGSSADLVAAGVLDDGKPGMRDFANTSTTSARRYTEFAVSIPAAEPIAIYSGRTLQVRYDDTIRDDSTGTYTGPVRPYNGSRFLVPSGTSRVVAKARRNDLAADGALDDQVTDSTKLEVFYTPRYLVIPRT